MSELKPPHDPIDVLGQAYEKMFETVAEDLQKAEEKTAPRLREFIAGAKEKLMAAGEVTAEEGEKLANYLERDLVDLAGAIAENGRELRDWLGFETAVLEDYFLTMLKTAADKTEVEWLKLKMEAAAQRPKYKTGEVVAPGTFECVECGEQVHLKKAGHLPPCPKCAHTEFKRISYD